MADLVQNDVVIMSKTEKKLLKKERKKEKILNANIWNVIFAIGLPLVFYNLCNYFYGIYDLMIVSKSQIGSVDAVAILDQIKNMISTLGASIAVGGSILVARKVGAKDDEGAKKNANNLFLFALVIALLTVVILIPFGSSFLRLLNTDQEVIDGSIGYFNVQMVIVAVVIMNNVFIGIEKARGNTSRLFYLNLIVVGLKILLTTLFVYFIPNVTVTYVAFATLIAQSSLLVFGLIILFMPSNPLGIVVKHLRFSKVIILPIIFISTPIFIGKFLFSFGKVFVNSQAGGLYGTVVVGALAISNSISGLITNVLNSFEDTASTITSQNLGNKNLKRTFEIFKKMLILSIALGLIGNVVLLTFNQQLANFFVPIDYAKLSAEEIAANLEKRKMIMNINFYESIALTFLALETAAFGFLYGYGKTALTMTVSFSRLFLFRIPPLLFMMYIIHVDYTSTGMAMGISNASAGVLSFFIAVYVIKGIKNNGMYKDILYEK